MNSEQLFDMKDITGHQHFWERVDLFFKMEIQQDIMNKLRNLYKMPEDACEALEPSLRSFLSKHTIIPHESIEQINFSKPLFKLLK